jgi:hypothetical protein
MRLQGGKGSGLKSSQQDEFSVTAVLGACCVIIAKGGSFKRHIY